MFAQAFPALAQCQDFVFNWFIKNHFSLPSSSAKRTYILMYRARVASCVRNLVRVTFENTCVKSHL